MSRCIYLGTDASEREAVSGRLARLLLAPVMASNRAFRSPEIRTSAVVR